MTSLYTISKTSEGQEDKRAFIVLHLKDTCIKNERLIELIALQTIEAFKNNELMARRPEMDFIMRLSVTDQIKKAQAMCIGDYATLFIFDKFDALPIVDFSDADLDFAEQAALLSTD